MRTLAPKSGPDTELVPNSSDAGLWDQPNLELSSEQSSSKPVRKSDPASYLTESDSELGANPPANNPLELASEAIKKLVPDSEARPESDLDSEFEPPKSRRRRSTRKSASKKESGLDKTHPGTQTLASTKADKPAARPKRKAKAAGGGPTPKKRGRKR